MCDNFELGEQLLSVCEDGELEKVILLLEKGANPNWRKCNETTIHVVYELTPLDCNKKYSVTSCRERNKVTPLHNASKNGHATVVKILLEAGADPNAGDSYEFTPIHLASRNGYEAVVEMLLNAGANPNAEDEFKHTPLHQTIYKGRDGHEAVAKLLLKAGADPTATNKFEKTPLDYANAKGMKVASLLER